MKKGLIIVAVAALLSACGSNDATEPMADAVATGSNSLTDMAQYTSIQWMDSTYQNIGQLKKGQVVEIAWRFKNVGDKPLVIQSVRPGCGCTVAESPKAPLAPGEEGTIKGKFDSNGQAESKHRKYISVDANTQGTPYHQLTFEVEVVN